MSYAQQSYDLADKINYSRTLGTSLQQLGHIHFMRNENTLALEYYRLSIPSCRAAKSDLTLTTVLLSIAKVFQKTGQNDSALFYSKQSLFLAQENEYTVEIRNAARLLSYYTEK